MVWLPVCPVTVSGPPAEPWKPLRAFKSKLEIKRAWHAISFRVYWGTCDWPRKLRKTSRVLLGPVFSNNCRSVTWLCHRGNAIILILLMSKTHAFSSHHISTQALQTWPRFCSITPTLYSPDCLRGHHIWYLTPLSAQISVSKFQNLSLIPLRNHGAWKNCGVWLIHSLKIWKLTQNFEISFKFWCPVVNNKHHTAERWDL